jgi:uncharacterized protein YdiU (UPF0061 family)
MSAFPSARGLEALRFDDSFARALPKDPSDAPGPRQVQGACYSEVLPTPMPAPRLLAHAAPVAALLGLDAGAVDPQVLAEICGGKQLLPGMRPYAACYGGHQFGSWAGQLGDGRAITLGEVLTAEHGRQELQLKGAGRTPYSRTADGRAVLRSSIREYLCSEAMHALGVPTTRALCLVGTGESVWRDILYDGHARQEPGAVVCRVAPSFIRFGNFELPAARREQGPLKSLADYVLTTHYPHLGAPSPDTYAALFDEVCSRTASLFVELMRVGFVHGVLNTDNMSILGLCIDYGPFGFMEAFDPDFTPNTTDRATRRYRYAAQPLVAKWNLARLGSALLPLAGNPFPLEKSLARFDDTFDAKLRVMWASKLGLSAFRDEGEGAGDQLLVAELQAALSSCRADMPLFFRALANLEAAQLSRAQDDHVLRALIPELVYEADATAPLFAWCKRYAERLSADTLSQAERKARMDAANPKYVLRNYLAQLAIDAAEGGDLSLLHSLEQVLAQPYAEQRDQAHFAAKRPAWAEVRPGCGMLSCSS